MRPIRLLPLLACLAAAPALLSACAGNKPRNPGVVVPTDEIALRERRGYELARQAADASKAGHTDQAIELYHQAVTVWPEIPSAWNNLGLLLMEQNNYMEAVEAFKTAARQDSTDPRPLVNVGVAYDRTGWAEEALDAYLQALERRPLEHDALLGAIAANHRLLAADRDALQRVKTALMIEQDDTVRAWLERERFRIESRLATSAAEAPRIPGPTPRQNRGANAPSASPGQATPPDPR